MQLFKSRTIFVARFLEKQIEKAKEKEPEKVCLSCDFKIFFDCNIFKLSQNSKYPWILHQMH